MTDNKRYTLDDLKSMKTSDLQQLARTLESRERNMNAIINSREAQFGNMPQNGAIQHFGRVNNEGTDLDRVLWPRFHSVTPATILAKGGGIGKGLFQVSTEAAFIWTELVKVVYAVDFSNPSAPAIEYIDPRNFNGNGDANGLSFNLVDASSGRSFMNDFIPLDVIARPDEVFTPDRPLMFAANQLVEVNFSNENPNRDYVVFLVFKGLSIRADGRHELVTAML